MCLALQLQSCRSVSENKTERQDKEKKSSEAASYNVQLGLAYLKQNDRPRAKRKLLNARRLDEKSPDVNSALAYYFEKSGEMEEAKKYYDKALVLSHNSGAQLNNYGTFLCRQGEYEQAEAYFVKAVKDEQYLHTAGAYENAGLCAMGIPNMAKAKMYFNHALQQDPSRQQSLEELITMAMQQKKPEEVLALAKQYSDTANDDDQIIQAALSAAEQTQNSALTQQYQMRLSQLNHSETNGGSNEYDHQIG